jgi:hypothetical protein
VAVETKRGCGYRKIGGLYLVSGPGGRACDRMPLPLTVCPTCSHGFKQSRGWTWVDLPALVGGPHNPCSDSKDDYCPVCCPYSVQTKVGLLWVGEKFYRTPADFNKEGVELGISRRIAAVPRGFRPGETWILMAHPRTIRDGCAVCDGAGLIKGKECATCDGKGWMYIAGIFTAWKPGRIEKILPESKRGSEEAQELLDRGITPVFVPDNDPDHQGTVYDKDEEVEEREVSNTND